MLTIAESDQEEELVTPTSFAVFDALILGETVPEGFHAVRIPLDGTMQGNLDWSDAKKTASDYAAKGLKIFWDLDLGLFNRLTQPLAHQGQFQSLILALEHVRDTLWKEFRRQTVGISIYRGCGDISREFPWDEMSIGNLQQALKTAFSTIDGLNATLGLNFHSFQEITPINLQKSREGAACISLFCRDAAAEYFELLSQKIPDLLIRFLLLDMEGIEDPLLKAQLLNTERYPSYLLGVKNAKNSGGHLGWNEQSLSSGFIGREFQQQLVEPPDTAICLPSMHAWDSIFSDEFRQIFSHLEKQKTAYRVIPEAQLTSSWDGLNVLYVAERYITPQGRRKLQGFMAAGGTCKIWKSESL